MNSMFYRDGLPIDGLPHHTYREEQEEIYNNFFTNISPEILGKIQEEYAKYYKFHFASKEDKGFPKDLSVILSFAQCFKDKNLPTATLNSKENLQKLINDGFKFNSINFDMQIMSGTKPYIQHSIYEGTALVVTINLMSEKELEKAEKDEDENER